MSTRGQRPHLRDVVTLDGIEYRVVAEGVRPARGYWLGREGGAAICQKFVSLTDWTLHWNATAHRWEEGE